MIARLRRYPRTAVGLVLYLTLTVAALAGGPAAALGAAVLTGSIVAAGSVHHA